MDKNMYSRPLSLKDIKITDKFWKNEMELIRKEVIPYQWEALNDRVPDAAPSFCMRNFKTAGKMNREKKEKGESYQEPAYTFRGFEALPEDPAHLEDKFYGFVFQDSDFSKWIEAVGYSLAQYKDPELERIADEAIEIVCAAQQEDGYLDTYYIINGKDKIFSNLRDNHELYCFGHLTEGAVAYYQATGKDKLLKAAERFADYIADYFGPEENKCKGYPGHEVAEMALMRLYEATGNEKYLELGKFFIDERGKRPYYFDKEHPVQGKEEELRYQYQQAHLPVRQQDEAVGHAVRAVYLYSGMADIARLTGDERLHEACVRLWDSITEEKMYITGGIGATHLGEAFSYPYDLPNDTAYAETCASIGLVFFARRMLEITPDARYANVMERALYNGILSGMSLDGKSFFYVNPLESVPEACRRDERKSHVKPVRQKWFGCACCPPNLARLVSSVGSYAFTENEDTLFIHLYVGGTLAKKVGEEDVDVQISSLFPWSGEVEIRVRAKGIPFKLALRIPDWCEECRISGLKDTKASIKISDLADAKANIQASGLADDKASIQTSDSADVKASIKTSDSAAVLTDVPVGVSMKMKNGYLYVKKEWEEEERIKLIFPMEVKLAGANSRVREDVGKAAVTRGPVVYCMEEADNGKNLHLLSVSSKPMQESVDMSIGDTAVKAVLADGFREEPAAKGQGLYGAYTPPKKERVRLKYIPYYVWANRGENEMQVWTRVEEKE